MLTFGFAQDTNPGPLGESPVFDPSINPPHPSPYVHFFPLHTAPVTITMATRG